MAAALLLAGPALAQGYGPQPYPPAAAPGAIIAPELIARCLCTQQRVRDLKQQAADAQRRFDDAKGRLDALNRQMEESRRTVDSDDNTQVDAFRRLVEEDERANAHLFNNVLPETQRVIGRYNASVADFNRDCAGRSFDEAAQAQVRATLNCAPAAEPITSQPLEPLE